MVRETGGRNVSRPVFRDRPDLDMTVTDAETVAGMKAADRLTRAARALSLGYVRQAREDGRTWHEIGDALGLADRAEPDEPIAYAAFNHVTQGHREPSFSWTCSACHRTVIDYGPAAGPPVDAETRHADDCAAHRHHGRLERRMGSRGRVAMGETITLSTTGPHSPEYTRQVAYGLAECVRVLNYATGSGADAGISYPAVAYDVLGFLYTATARMPQLLEQFGLWLQQSADAGVLAEADPARHGEVVVSVAAARQSLAEAAACLGGAATTALQDAQNAISGLYIPGPAEEGSR